MGCSEFNPDINTFQICNLGAMNWHHLNMYFGNSVCGMRLSIPNISALWSLLTQCHSEGHSIVRQSFGCSSSSSSITPCFSCKHRPATKWPEFSRGIQALWGDTDGAGLTRPGGERVWGTLQQPAQSCKGVPGKTEPASSQWGAVGGKENWQWLKLERLRLDYKRGCFPMRPENGTGCPERLCCLLSSELTLLWAGCRAGWERR